MSVSRQKGISYMPQPSASSLYLTNQQKYSLNKLQKQHQNLANQIENSENKELQNQFDKNQNQNRQSQNGILGAGYSIQKNHSEFLHPQKSQLQSQSLDFKMPGLTKSQTSKNDQYRSSNNLMHRSRNFFGNNKDNENNGMQKRTLTSGQNAQSNNSNNNVNYSSYQYGSNLVPKKILGQQDKNSSKLPKIDNMGINRKLDSLHHSLHLSQLGQNTLGGQNFKKNSQQENGYDKTQEDKKNRFLRNGNDPQQTQNGQQSQYTNTLKQNASNIISSSNQNNNNFSNNYSQNYNAQKQNNSNNNSLQNSMAFNKNEKNGYQSSNHFLNLNKIDNEKSILNKNNKSIENDITHKPYEDEQNKQQNFDNSSQKNRQLRGSSNNVQVYSNVLSQNNNYNNKGGYNSKQNNGNLESVDKNSGNMQKQNGYQSFMNKPIIVQKDNYSVQIGDKVFKYAYKTKAGCTYQKQTKTNQDTAIVNPQNPKDAGVLLFAVADGHGVNGHYVSQQIKNSLPKTIQNNLENLNLSDSNQIMNGISKAVLQTNQEIINSNYDTNLSGSTLISVVTNGKQIWTANVGDSRAVMARQERTGIKAIPMSVDLKPCLERERLRIIRAGGRVDRQKDYSGYPVGPLRVWLKNLDIPGLAMTRSIGDKVGNQAGVIPDPEMIESTIQSEDKFMVIASDGVWEYMDDQQVIKLVAPYVEKGQLELACEKLVSEATLTWKRESFARDDITAVIVTINQNRYGNNNLQSNNNNNNFSKSNNYGGIFN